MGRMRIFLMVVLLSLAMGAGWSQAPGPPSLEGTWLVDWPIAGAIQGGKMITFSWSFDAIPLLRFFQSWVVDADGKGVYCTWDHAPGSVPSPTPKAAKTGPATWEIRSGTSRIRMTVNGEVSEYTAGWIDSDNAVLLSYGSSTGVVIVGLLRRP